MQEQRPIRIAQIVGKMNSGGVENFIMNYYRNIDRTKIQFDFIVDSDSKMVPRDEIEMLGGRVFDVPPYQKLFKYMKSMRMIFKENQYKIVHSHISTLSVFPLLCAKIENIPIRIAHSHSTSTKKEWKRNFIKNILRPFSKTFSTHYFACSDVAGKWLFGKKSFKNNEIIVIENAIDVEKFAFSEKKRKKIREKNNISDKFVIGHVGRLVKSKNHEFLIDVFCELQKKCPNAVLMLVGDGPLKEQIENKLKELRIENKTIFLGIREDINELMMGMDVFVFPSYYEGFGMAVVEAQASGLPCIVSNNIPKEVKKADNVFFYDLSEKELIINKILEMKNNVRKENFILDSFNIKLESKKLEDIYFKILKND